MYSNRGDRLSYEKALDGLKRVDSLHRAKQNISLTVSANINKYSKFMTLTTAKTVLARADFLKMFNQFRKNFNRIFGYPLQYLAVLERQKLRGIKENNEGSWHIHLIVFNNDLLPYQKLKVAWCNYGSIDIKLLRHYTHIPVYLMKYLTKDNVGFNKKSILKSHHLKQPQRFYDINEIIPNEKNMYQSIYYLPDGSKVLYFEVPINKHGKQLQLEALEF